MQVLPLMPRIQLGEPSEDQARSTSAVTLFTPLVQDAPSPYMAPSLEWHEDSVLHELHRRPPSYEEELGASGTAIEDSLVYEMLALSPLGEARAMGRAQDA